MESTAAKTGAPTAALADRSARPPQHIGVRKDSRVPIVEYPAGSPFPGVIGRTADESEAAVTVDVSGDLITDPEAEMKLHMARQ
jgi:hypothetical protein